MKLLSTAILALLGSSVSATPDADIVDLDALKKTMGDFDIPLPDKMWSGYLKVNDDKQLHYLFVESKSTTKQDDPVLIWFNGGPGCSSLLGAFQENGPFTVDSDGDQVFATNPHPWNLRANVLYLEQPSGVGFSMALSEQAKIHSDYSASQDAIIGLNAWYEKFSEYKKNDLFISGESYGGIYVPYLTWQVYQQNLKTDVLNAQDHGNRTKINIKGMLVGNGVTNWAYDTNPSLPETLGGFDMIPNIMLEQYQQLACNVNFHGKVSGDDIEKCSELFEQMSNSIPSVLNPYDLYRKIPDEEQLSSLDEPGLCLAKTAPWMTWRKDKFKKLQETANLGNWLNQQDTQEALHVYYPEPHHLEWQDCNGQINQNWRFQPEASQWIYTVLKTSGYIRMMFYSGDTDGVLPTYGSKQWIEELNWPKTSKYTMWKTNDQVSGFYQKYDGLDFVTVKGVGHMAPQWARQPMQEIVNKWIHQEDMFHN